MVSAYSPGQARFEIERGRCGVLVTCTLVPDIVNRDLMQLFRQHCPSGLVILISGDDKALVAAHEPLADVLLTRAEDPDGIVPAIEEDQKNQDNLSQSSDGTRHGHSVRSGYRRS